MAEPLDFALAAAALFTMAIALGAVPPRRGTPSAQMTQVMGFLLLGVIATLIWLRLGSVDVALAEAGLGGGLLGAVLVCCAVGARKHTPNPEPNVSPQANADAQVGEETQASADAPPSGKAPSRQKTRPRTALWRSALAWICGAVLVVVLAAVWLRVDQRLPTWSAPVQQQLPETGVEHGVTAVLLAFRAYDTLLESAVLMLAGLAVLALDPSRKHHRARRRTTSLPDNAASPRISSVWWAGRLIAPVLLLVALWLLFAGSSDSGGAFQSGAVLTAMLILLHATGTPLGKLTRWLPGLMVTGVAAFLLAALLGPLSSAAWFSLQPEWSFAVILTVEVLLTVGIAAALYTIFLQLGLPSPEPTPEAEAETSADTGASTDAYLQRSQHPERPRQTEQPQQAPSEPGGAQ